MSIERKYKVEIAAGLGMAVIGGVAIFYAQRAHRKNKYTEPNPGILNETRMKSDKLQRVNLMAAYILTTPEPTLTDAVRILDIHKPHASNAINYLMDNGLAIHTYAPKDEGGMKQYYQPTETLVDAAADTQNYSLLSAAIEVLLEQHGQYPEN